MPGQGRPYQRYSCVKARLWRLALALVIAFFGSAEAELAPLPTRIFVRWGTMTNGSNKTPRAWSGSITLSNGRWESLDHLATDADAIGSVWIDGAQIRIRQSSELAMNAFEADIIASADAVLQINLTAPDHEPQQFELPLKRLTTPRTHELLSPNELLSGRSDRIERELDQQGNMLELSVVGSEQLKVDPRRPSLVFTPGETWTPNIDFRIPGLTARQNIRLNAGFRDDRGNEIADSVIRKSLQTDDSGRLPPLNDLTLTLPSTEGSHMFFVELQRQGLSVRRSLLRRQFDVLVLAQTAPQESETPPKEPPFLVEDLDLTHPDWSQRLTRLPRIPLPGVKRDANAPRLEERAGKRWLVLSPDTWQAYPIAIESIGKPHVIDVEFTTNYAQSLGIAIVEAESDGSNPQVLADTGINVPPSGAYMALSESTAVDSYRLSFWPNRKNIWLIFTNRDPHRDASYARAKLSCYAQGLQIDTPPAPRERLAAFMLTTPQFTRLFGDQRNDNWNSYYQAANRMLEYCSTRGFNAIILPITAEGGCLYPTNTLPNLPRFDRGITTPDRQPIRKDVAEIVFRLADRKGMLVIPAVSFDTPLPPIERLRQTITTDHFSEMLQSEASADRDLDIPATRPLYNPLHSRIQDAMRQSVRELASRYEHHPSYAGILLQFRNSGYSQLHTPEAGMSESAFAQFAQSLPSTSSISTTPSWEGAQILFGPARSQWIDWTCDQMLRFHTELAADSCPKPGNRLYLALDDLLQSDIHSNHNRSIDQTTQIQRLMEMGLDVQSLSKVNSLVLLHRYSEDNISIISQASTDSSQPSNQPTETDASMHPAYGVIFQAPMHPKQLPGLVGKSSLSVPPTPFDLGLRHESNPPIELHTTLSQVGVLARRDLVQALADDDWSILIEKSGHIPQGNTTLLRPWLDAFRSLPQGAATAVKQRSLSGNIPLIVRVYSSPRSTRLCTVNDSPVEIRLKIGIQAPASVRARSAFPSSNSTVRRDDKRSNLVWWNVTLKPYDLAIADIDGPSAEITTTSAEVVDPPLVHERLQARLREIESRLVGLRERLDFDSPDSPPWTGAQTESVITGAPDPESPKNRTLQIQCSGTTTSVQSPPIVLPPTGSVSIQGRIRAAYASKPPLIRMRLLGSTEFAQHDILPTSGLGWQKTPEIVWNSLPYTPDTPFRLLMECEGEGTVWLDDIELSSFTTKDRIGLSRMMIAANNHLRNGKLIECAKILDGNWPRLVLTEYSHRTPRIAAQPAKSATKDAPTAKPTTSNWFRLTR